MYKKFMTLQQETFKQKNTITPAWFMRQAGRYLPEYMEIRKNFWDFLERCYDSKQAAEVTIQPIQRFGFDAVLYFNITSCTWLEICFEKGEGQVLQKFKSEKDLANRYYY